MRLAGQCEKCGYLPNIVTYHKCVSTQLQFLAMGLIYNPKTGLLDPIEWPRIVRLPASDPAHSKLSAKQESD